MLNETITQQPTFTQCMQTGWGNVVIALFVFGALSFLFLVILLIIILNILKKDKKVDSPSNSNVLH
jgi:hypothetical protein